MAQYTKLAIMESFIILLNKTPLEKITVKDIVDFCKINRNTFYYYFQDKFDLLDQIFKIQAGRFISVTTTYHSWQERFIETSKFIYKNKNAVLNAYNGIGREKLESYLYEVVTPIMVSFVKNESLGISAGEEDVKFIADFYKYALVGMVLDWLSNGMKQDMNEMINKLSDMLKGSITMALTKTKNNKLIKAEQ